MDMPVKAWAVVDKYGRIFPGPKGVTFIYETKSQAEMWVGYLGVGVKPVMVIITTGHE